MPAIAAAGGAISPPADAELLELGRHLDVLLDEHAAVSERVNELNATHGPVLAARASESLEVLRATSDDLATIGDPDTVGGIWSYAVITQKLAEYRNNPTITARLRELLRLENERNEAFWQDRIDCGLEGACEAQRQVCDRIDAIGERIRAIPAKTFEGLAVKAQLLTFDTSLWNEEEDDMDWNQLMLKKFLEEVLSHAAA